jgi:hypothetical protein
LCRTFLLDPSMYLFGKSIFSGQYLVCLILGKFLFRKLHLLMWRHTQRSSTGGLSPVNKNNVSNRCCLVSKLYRRNWPTELEFLLLHFRRRWQVSFWHFHMITHKGEG